MFFLLTVAVSFMMLVLLLLALMLLILLLLMYVHVYAAWFMLYGAVYVYGVCLCMVYVTRHKNHAYVNTCCAKNRC